MKYKLIPSCVVRAMEKADPTIRVSVSTDPRGKPIYIKRPKTEKELEMEKMIADLSTNLQIKADGILAKAKALDTTNGVFDKNNQVSTPNISI